MAWKTSRYTVLFPNTSQGFLIYNSLQGAIARVPHRDESLVANAIEAGFTGMPDGLLADLCQSGFFVLDGTDELVIVERIHQQQHQTDESMDLIILPTGQCNFRCTYCYETFTHGEMSKVISDSILRMVELNCKGMKDLRVGWFGGEPLVAYGTMIYLLKGFREICSRNGVTLRGGMSTNGYLLNKNAALVLMEYSMRRFQITLDGPQEIHDKQRCLADGSATYDRILANLRDLKSIKEPYRVVIRVNFHKKSFDRIPAMIKSLASEFSGDGRFTMDFHPVGEWSDTSPTGLPTCSFLEGSALKMDLHEIAVNAGFDSYMLLSRLRPYGSVCYAANPRSVVIGPDGTLHKCTVAFDDPRNNLGNITESNIFPTRSKELDSWIHMGEEIDSICQNCFLRPVCQGNACPYARIKNNERACPMKSGQLSRFVEIVATDLLRNHSQVALENRFQRMNDTQAV